MDGWMERQTETLEKKFVYSYFHFYVYLYLYLCIYLCCFIAYLLHVIILCVYECGTKEFQLYSFYFPIYYVIGCKKETGKRKRKR